jgi:hypothetical protein
MKHITGPKLNAPVDPAKKTRQGRLHVALSCERQAEAVQALKFQA